MIDDPTGVDANPAGKHPLQIRHGIGKEARQHGDANVGGDRLAGHLQVCRRGTPAAPIPGGIPSSKPALRLIGSALIAFAATAFAGGPPEHLHGTGLHSDAKREVLSAGVIEFAPQYSLWSDGTRKRRWIYLPPGSSIDASNPDAWQFPRGTKLWKEFAYGSRIETRFIALGADGRWTFATYVWNGTGTEAVRAPERGIARLAVADATEGRYTIPSRNDCLTCHAGARAPVLGFSALQLGDALPELVRRGLVRRGPAAWRSTAPVIAAKTSSERAARGHCTPIAAIATMSAVRRSPWCSPSASPAHLRRGCRL